MKIKAVGITNLTDARYFAAQGAEWMHFDFRITSPFYIESANAEAIMNWVDGIDFAGEWATHDVDILNQNLRDTHIKAIQIGEDFPIENIPLIEADTVFRKIFVFEHIDSAALQARIDIGQLNSEISHSKRVITEIIFPKNGFHGWFGGDNPTNFASLKHLTEKFSVSLDINFNENDWVQLKQLDLYALCLHGGEEEQVGVKSYDALDNIFDALSVYD